MGGDEVPYLKTMQDFKDALKNNERVALDFTATWCPPCKMIGPKFVEQKTKFPTIYFAKVDVDENSDLSHDQDISAMPTFLFYKDGALVKALNLTGADEAGLIAKLNALKDL